MRALGVAVASTVLGTGRVGREAGLATVSVHLDEVERAVETAREVGHVNVESELLVLQVEHLVRGVVLGEEVDTGTDVLGVRALLDELEVELVAARRDTVGAYRKKNNSLQC